jgi:hypothetical protein
MCTAVDLIREKMRDAPGRAASSNPREFVRITLSGEATREAPAPAELRPTCTEAPHSTVLGPSGVESVSPLFLSVELIGDHKARLFLHPMRCDLVGRRKTLSV